MWHHSATKSQWSKLEEYAPPKLKTLIIWTPIFERYMVRCESKNRHHEVRVLDRDWIACSKYANHSTLNSQNHWGDLYDHLMTTKIFTSIVNKIFIRAPEIMRQMAICMNWIC